MTPRAEAEAVYTMFDGDLSRSIALLDAQLNTLHGRAQVLMSLAGVITTVTGFSGRLIAGTNMTAQIGVVAGLATVLSSAVWLYMTVMRIRWITTDIDVPAVEALENIIIRRNRKTAAYLHGGVVLCAGIVFYAVAFSIMLLNPTEGVLPAR